jgi:hypothetical protein
MADAEDLEFRRADAIHNRLRVATDGAAMTGDLVLYALIGAALIGSVLGVFFEKLLIAVLAPLPMIAMPLGIVIAVRPYLERNPEMSDRLRDILDQLANPAVLLQMTVACAGAALIAGILVRLATTGQAKAPARRPHRSVIAQKRAAAVDRTPLQSRTDRLAAQRPIAPAKPTPVYEVAPVLAGGIRASSVGDIVRDGTQPDRAEANRRNRGRRRAILAGFLIMNDDRSSPCRIVDISDTGARVHLPTPMALPDKLWLLNTSDWLAYEAEVAWHTNMDAGLHFLSKRNLRNPVTERDHALHALCANLSAR